MQNSSLVEIESDYSQKSGSAFKPIEAINLKPYSRSDESSDYTKQPVNGNISTVINFRDIQQIRVPKLSKPPIKSLPSFKTICKWEAEIIEIYDNDSFQARIHKEDDDSNSADFEDYIDFSIFEVKEDERKYIVKGALFSWHVGHEITDKGQCKNSSLIVFRMMPVWGSIENKAKIKAIYYSNLIKKFSK